MMKAKNIFIIYIINLGGPTSSFILDVIYPEIVGNNTIKRIIFLILSHITGKKTNFGTCEIKISAMKLISSVLLLLSIIAYHNVNAQIITTISGTTTAGFTGDNGPATAAKLNSPHDVVVFAGNIYISDQNNNRVRKINPAGIMTTIAGNGTAGFLGDGGPASAAELDLPTGLAIDNTGNLYIADQSNYRVRKINTSGIISTIAGNGVFTYTADGIAATAAGLFPTAITLDTSGNLFIAELSNNRVRKVNTSGIISTIAGNGVGGFGGDSGPATDAKDRKSVV